MSILRHRRRALPPSRAAQAPEESSAKTQTQEKVTGIISCDDHGGGQALPATTNSCHCFGGFCTVHLPLLPALQQPRASSCHLRAPSSGAVKTRPAQEAQHGSTSLPLRVSALPTVAPLMRMRLGKKPSAPSHKCQRNGVCLPQGREDRTHKTFSGTLKGGGLAGGRAINPSRGPGVTLSYDLGGKRKPHLSNHRHRLIGIAFSTQR